jgi:hypothetical protein
MSGLSFDLPTFPISFLPPSFEVWVGNLDPRYEVGGESSNAGVIASPNAMAELHFPLQRTEISAHITNGVARAKVTHLSQ